MAKHKTAKKAAAATHAAPAAHAGRRGGPMAGKTPAQKADMIKRAKATRAANKAEHQRKLAIKRSKPGYKKLAPLDYLEKRMEYLKKAMEVKGRPLHAEKAKYV